MAVLIDNNSTYFNETVSIESFTITGTDNEVVYDNADTVQDIFTYTVTDDVGQHFTAELDVTIYDSMVIAGSSGDDPLIGTNGNDSIVGGAGSDSIDAGAGDDIIYFDKNDSHIDGGDGTDTLMISIVYSTSVTLLMVPLRILKGWTLVTI